MSEVELIATYRELVRLHTQLCDEVARYRNEIHAELAVLFPEFTQVFADPCRPTALALLQLYPSASAMAAASVETLATTLRELAPRNYGEDTAKLLVELAQHSVSRGRATAARASSLKILCDQLQHTQGNLALLAAEIDRLVEGDSGATGLGSVPEFGRHRGSGTTSRMRRCQPFSTHRSGSRLCGARYPGEGERQMERAGQAL